MVGEGSFGEVKHVRLKETGKDYALKIMLKSFIMREKKDRAIVTERNTMDRLDNPGIVRLCFTFQDEDHLYMATELCRAGELFDQIHQKTKLDLESARFYAAEVVLMLEYLASEGIVHRDLKPENVLLTEDGHLKLMDFGSAKDLKHPDRKRRSTVRPPSSRNSTDERKSTFVGTADYVSPEMLLGREASYTMDVWALGCLLFQMLVGKPPFRAGSEYLTFQKVQAALYQTPVDVDRQAADLIGKLLVAEPEDRLGCGPEGHEAGFAAIKAHPFFAGVDWANLRAAEAPKFLPPLRTAELAHNGVLAEFDTGMSMRDLALTTSSEPSTAQSERLRGIQELSCEEPGEWSQFLEDGEKVRRMGMVKKHRSGNFLARMVAKERYLILTTRPRLLYIDPNNMELKGVIPLYAGEWRVEKASSKRFTVHCAGSKDYFFEEIGGKAVGWLEAFEDMRRPSTSTVKMTRDVGLSI